MTAHDTLTATGIRTLLEEAEFRVLVCQPDGVVAERAVLGMPHCFRVVAAQQNPDHTWRVTMSQKRQSQRPNRLYDRDVLCDRSGLPLRRPCIADPLEFGLFLGGALSVPVDAAEVAAIQHGPAAA